ncbi:MAG: energy-coupling factor ABC transporter permease [Isosphaeraceae bacterium]
MHIPDAVLDPRVAALTGILGAAGLFYGLKSVEGQLKERTTSLMGMMSAFIFAAQMVNFPVGPGVSGHLLGGVLAAVMLGPWAGAVVIAAVLIVQCFLFGDGGLTALGANFVNMGLIGSVVGYAIYAPIRRWIGGQRGILIAAMIAAWFTVLLAAGACAAELSASGNHRDFFRILSWMALVHAVIGLGEAIITGLVVRFILLTRPDLIEQDPTFALEPQVRGGGPPRRWLAAILGGLGVALAVVVFLSPLASELPDGLEFVGQRIGFLAAESPSSPIPVPMPDYQFPLPSLEHVKAATAVAGLVGTLVVFAVSWGLARVFSGAGRRSERASADAA